VVRDLRRLVYFDEYIVHIEKKLDFLEERPAISNPIGIAENLSKNLSCSICNRITKSLF
jgi:hypothetical protein